jgi:TolB-like protein
MSGTAGALPELVQDELARLCEGEALRRSPGHARLLRYLVARALEDDGAALTETAIAIAVFRRDPAVYDPHVDPIVRVAMGRLRARLDGWYTDMRAARPLRIVVPKGGYRPRFVAASVDEPPRPRLVVLPMRRAASTPMHDSYCRTFSGMLAEALERFGEQAVVHREAQRRGAAEAALDARAAEALLDPFLSTDGDGSLRITVRLIDAVDANIWWAETVAGAPGQRAALARRMVAKVLARVGRAARPARGT